MKVGSTPHEDASGKRTARWFSLTDAFEHYDYLLTKAYEIGRAHV